MAAVSTCCYAQLHCLEKTLPNIFFVLYYLIFLFLCFMYVCLYSYKVKLKGKVFPYSLPSVVV